MSSRPGTRGPSTRAKRDLELLRAPRQRPAPRPQPRAAGHDPGSDGPNPSGQPRPGQPRPGQPKAGQPKAGQPKAGQPKAGRSGPAQRTQDPQLLRRALTLLGFTLVAPGSAQLVAGRRDVGRAALRAWFGALGVILLLGVVWFVHRQSVLWLATQSLVLRLMAALLILLALAWPALMIDAWRLSAPPRLPVRSRRWIALLAGALAVVTLVVPLAAGRRAWSAADLIGGVFNSGRTSAAVDGRYTVLLLGGDAGPDRVGTRPDSVTLASIDEKDGRTVLFSFPRNLQNIPFPAGTAAARALPNGWSCGDECLLNAIYTWGSQHPELFGGVADPGAEAMKQAVQGITGLKVNYYVLIDLKGFRSLIDAVGGIDIVAANRVPIGGGTSKIYGWIEPGKQHMNGFHALWYARSREGASDYARMQRQRCVMTAMVNQLDPGTLLRRFQKIAAAGKQVVSTDIPAGQLPAFITLGEQAKDRKIDSVQFVPPLIVPHHPDFTVIRQKVTQAIAANQTGGSAPVTVAPVRATPSTGPGATPSAAASTPASAGADGAAGAVDVRQVCQPA